MSKKQKIEVPAHLYHTTNKYLKRQISRRDFLARHPDTELTGPLERKVARQEVLLYRTLARRRVRAGDRALDAGQPRLALHQAKTAVEILEARPEENPILRKQAKRLVKRCQNAVAELERLRARSLEASWLPPRETWAPYWHICHPIWLMGSVAAFLLSAATVLPCIVSRMRNTR